MFFKPRKIRRIKALAAAVAACTVLAGVNPGVATAQEIPNAVDLENQLRDNAWNTRNQLHEQADQMLDPQTAQDAKNAVDGAVNEVMPGMIDERQSAQQAAEQEAAAKEQEAARANFDYGSCPKTAAACIDLAKQRTWLQKDGVVWGGEKPMSSGAPGWETPKGTHKVLRKVKDEVSRQFDNAPMPYSVYFTNTGVAFHSGDVNLWSHGCIHLNHDDAVLYFNELKLGDTVYVY